MRAARQQGETSCDVLEQLRVALLLQAFDARQVFEIVRSAAVRFEGRIILVEFVEQEAAWFFARLMNVEAQAARLSLHKTHIGAEHVRSLLLAAGFDHQMDSEADHRISANILKDAKGLH